MQNIVQFSSTKLSIASAAASQTKNMMKTAIPAVLLLLTNELIAFMSIERSVVGRERIKCRTSKFTCDELFIDVALYVDTSASMECLISIEDR